MIIWVKTEKTIEIQLVRLTEVCGKVLSEKNAYKSVKVRLRWFGAVLRYSGKYVLVLLSIDARRRTVYH